MRKIGEVNPVNYHKMCIYYDSETDRNRYVLIEEWYELTEYGRKKRRKQIARYSDLGSCVCLIEMTVLHHNEVER